jgi:hypothetical protein
MTKNPFTYLGTDEETLKFEESPDVVVSEIHAALSSIGTVVAFDPEARFLRGRTRFGLQRVWLEILVHDEGDGSVAGVRSAADDIWGAGARRAVKKLLKAITQQGGSFEIRAS